MQTSARVLIHSAVLPPAATTPGKCETTELGCLYLV